MAVIEAETTKVIEHEHFASTVTEEAICLILQSPRLVVPEEFALYLTVIRCTTWDMSLIFHLQEFQNE